MSTQTHRQNDTTNSDNWQGYELQIPLDEIIDCTKCPLKCQTCYFKAKHAPKYSKAIYVTIILSVTCIWVALMFRFGIYGTKQYLMGPGDQRLLMNMEKNKEDFSRLLCDGFDVKSKLDQRTSAYIFTKTPSLQKGLEEHKTAQSAEIGPGLYPVWANHLNAESHYYTDKITVEASCSYFQPLFFYVFNKKSALDKFIDNGGRCSDCIYKQCSLVPCSTFEESKCQFSASHTGNYYMTMTAGIKDNVIVTFDFIRGRYDLSEAQEYCSSMSHCSARLPKQTKAIILTLPRNSSNDPDKFTTNCNADLGMYFAFFVAFPMGISLLIGLLAFCLMKLQENVMKDVEQADLQREYRRMGYRTNSAVVVPSISAAQDSANQDHRVPPPPYHEPIRISINSGRSPLVENEHPVSQSLPDYDSAVEDSLRTPDPPSYGSIRSDIDSRA